MNNSSAIIYIVLALAIGYAFAMPAYSDLGMLMDEKQKYQEALLKIQNIEARKTDLLAEYNSIPDVEKQNIETLLPKSFSFVKLVSDIDNVASKYGISINNISSGRVTQSLGDSIDPNLSRSPYQTSTIGFSFVSTYESFRKFMDELERSLRILDIQAVKISPQTESSNTYLFGVNFNTYSVE